VQLRELPEKKHPHKFEGMARRLFLNIYRWLGQTSAAEEKKCERKENKKRTTTTTNPKKKVTRES
jgi:hypothetical protein